MVGLERTTDYRGVGLQKFHCVYFLVMALVRSSYLLWQTIQFRYSTGKVYIRMYGDLHVRMYIRTCAMT